MFIILKGDIANGFTIFGPFGDQDHASQWQSVNIAMHEHSKIMPLLRPGENLGNNSPSPSVAAVIRNYAKWRTIAVIGTFGQGLRFYGPFRDCHSAESWSDDQWMFIEKDTPKIGVRFAIVDMTMGS